jgi:DNA-binding NarL/FixJ family response regulator
MIRVCLIGKDTAKEKVLLSSQSGIEVHVVEVGNFDHMLDDITSAHPHIVVISDVGSDLEADALSLHTYLRCPDAKTLIITDHDADYARLENTGFSCKGFMLHEQRHAIVRAVRVLNDGEAWLTRKLVSSVMDHLATSAAADKRKLQLVKNN